MDAEQDRMRAPAIPSRQVLLLFHRRRVRERHQRKHARSRWERQPPRGFSIPCEQVGRWELRRAATGIPLQSKVR